MKVSMRAPVAAAIAIAVSLIILAGYFLPSPTLQNLRATFLGWGVTLVGVAALVGIANLIGVHWRKVRDPRNRDIYSIFLIAAFLATLLAGLWLTPSNPKFQRIVLSIQVPVETSLMAVLSISLAFGCIRLLQRKRDLMSVLFVVSALIFLVISSGIFQFLEDIALFQGLLDMWEKIPLAGARGILLGVALGSITTGLRIILGADRPYSG
ncbi:MAG: hypothetical protein MUO76_08795 [Anaerolineaceae bacterium]|jgi:cytochrome bd-type quinol oxidase subunit 2|nr:hypothetical protein [Anaerolineaceae bacterium]